MICASELPTSACTLTATTNSRRSSSGTRCQHVGQRLGDRQPEPRLLDHGAELAAQRLGELLLHHLHPPLQRMARLERRLDQIERVGKLDQEGLEPAASA